MKIIQKISDRFWRAMLVKASRLFPHLYHQWEEDTGVTGDADAENYTRTYSAASWVYICVRKIAQTCASIALKFYKKSGEDVNEIVEGEVIDLFNEINPFLSCADLIEATVSHQLLNGNAYWAIETNGKKEIYPLRPDRVKIIPDAKEFIKGYLFNVNGEDIRYEADEIIHFKFFNAENEYYGLAPLAVARRTLTLDFYAIQSNINLFKNAPRPGGVVEVPEALQEDSYRRLTAEWEKAHKGVDNWHKLIVLDGGGKWKSTVMSPKDMEFLNLRKMNREEICAIFGVPPAEVGIFEYANYANSREQRRIFWEDTIIPLLRKIAGTINERFIQTFDSKMFCEFDLSNVPALKEDEKQKMEVATGLVGRNIITVNEARERYYGLEDVEWGNEPQIPTTPFSFSLSSPAKTIMIPAETKSINYTNEEYDLWKRFDARLTEQEKIFKQKIAKFLEEQRDRILENIQALSKKKDFSIKLSDAELAMVFNILLENELLTEITEGELQRIIGEIGRETQVEIGVDFDFNPVTPQIEAWMRSKIQRMVTSVNETTRYQIADIIVRAFEEGYTVQDISGQIADHLNRTRDYRSDRIARTEVIGANNKAKWEAYKQSGVVKKKQWIATLDERVRDTHERAHHQIRGIDEYFNVGSDLLMFPGDIGSPEEVINCRCTIKAIMEG